MVVQIVVKAFLGYISGKSLAHLGHILGIFGAYFRYIFGISWAYFGHILGIFWLYLGHILGISQAYFRHILVIILGISWAYISRCHDWLSRLVVKIVVKIEVISLPSPSSVAIFGIFQVFVQINTQICLSCYMEWGGSPPDIWPQNQHFLVSFLALYFTRSYLYQFGIFWFSKILTWGVHIDLYSMEVRGKGKKLIRHQTHVFSYFHLCLHQGHSCSSSP